MSAHRENGSTETVEDGALQRGGEGAVLLPFGDGGASPQALELAQTIAVGRGSELVVLNVVCLPEQTPLDLGPRSFDERHAVVSEVRETVEEEHPDVSTRGAVHIGRGRRSVLQEAVDRYGVDAIVADGSWNDTLLAPLARTPVEKLAASVDPPVVLPSDERLRGTVNSILVPVAGGPHSEYAIEIARNVARAHDAHIELLHVVPSLDSPDDTTGEEILEAGASLLEGFDGFDTWLLEAESVEGAIVEQSQYYSVTIIGGPRTPRFRRFVFGSKSKTIREAGSNSVVTVWR